MRFTTHLTSTLAISLAIGLIQLSAERFFLFGQETKTSSSTSPDVAPKDSAPRAQCPSIAQREKWFKPLARIRAELPSDRGLLPEDCSAAVFDASNSQAEPLTARPWGCTEFHWAPTNLAHQPLYFDDIPLERYGQTCSPILQPVLSGVHFFSVFPLIPYKIGVDCPYERVYTLGYYRPGSDAPCIRQRLPWELDAAAIEAGTVAGLILLLP